VKSWRTARSPHLVDDLLRQGGGAERSLSPSALLIAGAGAWTPSQKGNNDHKYNIFMIGVTVNPIDVMDERAQLAYAPAYANVYAILGCPATREALSARSEPGVINSPRVELPGEDAIHAQGRRTLNHRTRSPKSLASRVGDAGGRLTIDGHSGIGGKSSMRAAPRVLQTAIKDLRSLVR